jgi:copper chaperone
VSQDIYVRGMTCQHCVNSVTKELLKINEIEKVNVDLSLGKIEIKSNREINKSNLEEAVKEAGYELI